MKFLHGEYFFKEAGRFLQFQGSRAGLLKQLIYGGSFTPSAFSSLKLGAAASPIDKLLKDSALPPVTSEKPILFSVMPDLQCSMSYELTEVSTSRSTLRLTAEGLTSSRYQLNNNSRIVRYHISIKS